VKNGAAVPDKSAKVRHAADPAERNAAHCPPGRTSVPRTPPKATTKDPSPHPIHALHACRPAI